MKVVIDDDVCTGCGLCAETCPEVFELTNDAASVIGSEVPEDSMDNCRQAVEDCPVEAITIQEA
jgi:ferredoxin